MTLVRQMKAVFEPARPSTREVAIAVSGPNGEHVVWAAIKRGRNKPMANGPCW